MYSNLIVRIATPSLKAFTRDAIADLLKDYEGITLEVSEQPELPVPSLLEIQPTKPLVPEFSLVAMAHAVQHALDQMRPPT